VSKRSARLPVLESIVLVLSLACIATLSWLQQSRQPADENTYSSYDAAAGGLRAWYELLGREGAKVGRFEERLAFLGHDVGVLIVADPPISTAGLVNVDGSDGATLAAWVRDGGHLLVVGSAAFSALTAKELQLRSARSALAGTQSAEEVAPALRRFGVQRIAPEETERLRLHKNDRALLRDRLGTIALRYSFGKGQVVQVATGAIFRNAAIAQPDRPRLAYALVALLAAGPSLVAFDEALHGYVTPEHWWRVLPKAFVAAVVLALFVLGIGLAGAAIRLGPPRVAEQPRAPNTAEYIDALATLMERGRAARASLEYALASTRRLIASRLGTTGEGSASSIAARIERSDLRAAFLDLDALASDLAPTKADLVRGLRIAHRLREEYGTDGRGR